MVFPLTGYQQKPIPGAYIPQRAYNQGTPLQNGAIGHGIIFAMADGTCFPAKLALARQFDRLMDGDSPVFATQNHTINLRIEVSGRFVIPGYRSSYFHVYSGRGTTDGQGK